MGDRDGRVALVTGPGSGIGHAIATRFGREGASVAVNYHGHEEAAVALAEYHGDGGMLQHAEPI